MSEDRKSHVRSASRRQTIFSIVTIALGVIAIALIVWRISKAWRIEYGGAPREPPGIPTGGSFGPPGGAAAPGGLNTATTSTP